GYSSNTRYSSSMQSVSFVRSIESLIIHLPQLKHPQLTRRTDIFCFLANREKTHRVAVLVSDTLRPLLELRPCPLETVVGVAELPCRQRFPHDIILGIRRTNQHQRRTRKLEQHPFKSGKA